jgi:hypothetical protein
MIRLQPLAFLPAALAAFLLAAARPAAAGQPELPDARPVPRVQVVPLPYDQASFQVEGRELSRAHFSPQLLRRPFCYPFNGPAGRSLTRMGHPHDPISHSHHNSVWISHHDVGGVNFWADHGKDLGRIVHQRVEQYADGDESAWMLSVNHWQDPEGKVLLVERRRIEVRPLDAEGWWMLVDLQFEPPRGEPVALGQTPFGMIGVRMAKTIGVHDGGGRILNSEGQVNEAEVFRKPARWVDSSGPVSGETTGGITLMDHPNNPGHPTPFHVRDDGWMGVCLTLDEARVVEPGEPLRLRYGLWMHPGVPDRTAVEKQWEPFSRTELPPMERVKPAR